VAPRTDRCHGAIRGSSACAVSLRARALLGCKAGRYVRRSSPRRGSRHRVEPARDA
jgi:hypothetical protein